MAGEDAKKWDPWKKNLVVQSLHLILEEKSDRNWVEGRARRRGVQTDPSRTSRGGTRSFRDKFGPMLTRRQGGKGARLSGRGAEKRSGRGKVWGGSPSKPESQKAWKEPKSSSPKGCETGGGSPKGLFRPEKGREEQVR